jgi:hypothetical protein
VTVSPNIPQQDTLVLQTKLIEAFNRSQCQEVNSLAPLDELGRLAPLSLGIVAYCQKDPATALELFQRAESGDPSGVSLALLHARYEWKRNPARSRELWQRVLLLARDGATRLLARQYIEGTATGDEPIVLGDAWSYYVDARLGGGYETNPGLLAPSTSDIQGSLSVNGVLNAGVERRFGFGFLSSNYTLTGNAYPADTSADFVEHDLDLPVSFRAGSNEDVRIRPFGTYVTLGGNPYYLYGGGAVQGVAYRGKYRQLVQGSVYKDKYYAAILAPQSGTHFRFDYNWEFYPESWFVRFFFYLEHVQAGRTVDPSSGGSIPYSHNNIAVQTFLEYDLKWMILGLSMKLLFRADDNQASYKVGSANSSFIYKQRQDVQLYLSPGIAIPIQNGMHLILNYTLNRIFSNIGPLDYADENVFDQGLVAALRVNLEIL